MKHLWKVLSLSLVLGLSLGFTGCGDDDDAPSSYMIVDGKDYRLTSGIILATPANRIGEEAYVMTVYLYSSGIKYDKAAEDFTGKGHVAYITVSSSSSTGLPSGEYDFLDEITLDFDPFINFGGYHGTNLDLNSGEYQEFYDFIGDMKVELSDGVYRISYEGLDDFDEPFLIEFKGKLDFQVHDNPID